jgi:hypothetical protein
MHLNVRAAQFGNHGTEPRGGNGSVNLDPRQFDFQGNNSYISLGIIIRLRLNTMVLQWRNNHPKIHFPPRLYVYILIERGLDVLYSRASPHQGSRHEI